MAENVVIDGVAYAPKDDIREGLEDLLQQFLKSSDGLDNNERNKGMNEAYGLAAVKVRNLLNRKLNPPTPITLPL